jgi:hypothetical protein
MGPDADAVLKSHNATAYFHNGQRDSGWQTFGALN